VNGFRLYVLYALLSEEFIYVSGRPVFNLRSEQFAQRAYLKRCHTLEESQSLQAVSFEKGVQVL